MSYGEHPPHVFYVAANNPDQARTRSGMWWRHTRSDARADCTANGFRYVYSNVDNFRNPVDDLGAGGPIASPKPYGMDETR